MKLSNKMKNISLAVIIVAIFLTLMIVGTFKDLDIANAFSSMFLNDGFRYSNNFFPIIGEAIGQLPIFIFTGLGLLFYYDYFVNKEETKFKVLGYCFLFLVFVAFSYGGYDVTNRSLKVLGQTVSKVVILGIGVIIGLLATGTSYFYIRDHKIQDKNKTLKLALMITFVCAIFLVNEVIKFPVARMRFRAMNVIGDYSAYTKWFEFSKAKQTYADLLSSGVLISDDFQAFPSGHAYSAATSFILIALPSLYERFNKRGWKILLYTLPVVWTSFVMISRMASGAHYLTDVTFGAFFALGMVFLFRYIFILRKPKNKVN